MAKYNAPITYTQWADKEGKPTPWFYLFIKDLWERTGGFSDEVEGDGSASSTPALLATLAIRLDELEQMPSKNSATTIKRLEDLEQMPVLNFGDIIKRLEDLEQQQ